MGKRVLKTQKAALSLRLDNLFEYLKFRHPSPVFHK